MPMHDGGVTGIVAGSIVALVAVTFPAAAQQKDFLTDDNALMHFVMPDDWRFGRVLGPCENLKLHRMNYNGYRGFRIQGVCPIKGLADGDSECPSYLIQADGTVDTPRNAAIRKITLTLKCDPEQ
jgi:hypothetical protein